MVPHSRQIHRSAEHRSSIHLSWIFTFISKSFRRRWLNSQDNPKPARQLTLIDADETQSRFLTTCINLQLSSDRSDV